ncbi:hypothetical protein [Methylocaldum sp.]|uniref:hypothetical protein n=1 Tax=Methylocaldum sp. TaxID=1969727 RepID=UPI002D2B73EF|nr:hypothetical protein [Methylocaldum sp.]HYE35388.1 hypothetical protein [Methylocaldum sp.]
MSSKETGECAGKSGEGLRRRLPPYGKRLAAVPVQTLAVLTGSEAWLQAASKTWFPGRKLLLPFGEDPAGFDWSPAEAFPDCLILTFGKPESAEVIMTLAAHLLNFVGLILHLRPGDRVIRFEARSP